MTISSKRVLRRRLPARAPKGWRRVAGPRVTRAPLLQHRPTRSSVIPATLAVFAALVLAPGSAAARAGTADDLPTYSACVGPATVSFGFVDTMGHVAEEAINCLAYYGITSGTAPDRFTPDRPITRREMAVFLVRAADLVGLSLPEAEDQGFEDLEALAPIFRDAINRIAALGITRGTSPTTFHPEAPMDRRHMALFLHRFLLKSATGPGGVDAARVTPDDDVFEDLGSEPAAYATAVEVLYEMGVTSGRTATTFAPARLVTRAQMALFMTRALAHTNARPAGVTMQSESDLVSSGDTVEVHIAVRNAKFRPRSSALLDVFSTPAEDPYASFGSDERCVPSVEAVYGSQVCVIDRSDRRLDEMGNLTVVLEATGDVLMWAWVGSQGDVFRINTTESGSIRIEVLKPPAALRVRDDMNRTARVLRLGDTLQMMFQLVSDDGRPVGEAGVRVQLSTTYEINGVTGLTSIKTYRTDGDGRVTVPFRAVDPDSTTSDDSVTLDVDVMVTALKVTDQTTRRVVVHDADENDDAVVMWVEQAAAPSTLRVLQISPYHELSGSGPGPANLVRAILADQYGEPVPDTAIRFSSNQGAGLGTGRDTRNTDRRGVASLRYLWTGGEAASERISAETSNGHVTAAPVDHYWAAPKAGGSSVLGVEMLVSDVGRNVILHDASSPRLLRYDGNDRFSIRGAVVSMAEFEEVLASGAFTRISSTRYSADPRDVSSFDLTNTRIFETT